MTGDSVPGLRFKPKNSEPINRTLMTRHRMGLYFHLVSAVYQASAVNSTSIEILTSSPTTNPPVSRAWL